MGSKQPERVAWVTGGGGFLGRHLLNHLTQEGHCVGALGRGIVQLSAASVSLDGEVSSSSLTRLYAATGAPHVIFHAAGSGTVGASLANPEQSFDDTVVSTIELTNFLKEHAPEATLIYPSSCAVYGNVGALPIPEDCSVRPISSYGAHKAMAEILCQLLVQQSNIKCGVIRFFSVYGPGLRKQLMWDVAKRLLHRADRLDLGGSGQETRDFLHVQDAMHLTMAVVRHLARATSTDDRFVVVNGGTGRATAVEEVVDLIQKALGTTTTITFSGVMREGDPRHYRADVDKATSLGFVPSWSLEEGIKEYCNWVQNEPRATERL